MTHYFTIAVWLTIGVYAILVQTVLVRFSYLGHTLLIGDTYLTIMARARLRSNFMRLSIIVVNLLVGVAAIFTPPAVPTVLGTVITVGFISNEIGMATIATLELHAHLKLRRMVKDMGFLAESTAGTLTP